MAASLQATGNLNRLGEVSFVRNLDDVAPGSLVVFGENWGGIFYFGWTRGGRTIVSWSGRWTDFLSAFRHVCVWCRKRCRRWFALDGSVKGAETNGRKKTCYLSMNKLIFNKPKLTLHHRRRIFVEHGSLLAPISSRCHRGRAPVWSGPCGVRV